MTSRLTTASLSHRLLVGVAPLLEFDDGDKLLACRSSGTAIAATRPRGYLLDRRLDVVGRVVAPVDDQEILDAADDEQLAVGDEAQNLRFSATALRVCRPTERQAFRRKCARSLRVSANSPWRRCRRAPRSRRSFPLDTRSACRDRRCAPSVTRGTPITDQRCAASAFAPLRVAGGKFLGFEVDDFRWLTRSAGRRRTPLLPRAHRRAGPPCRED